MIMNLNVKEITPNTLQTKLLRDKSSRSIYSGDFCCIQKITEMVFPKVYFFSALLAGVVGGILTMLTLKILEARPREQTRVEVDNGRETEGRMGIGVQESTELEQEHDERCC